MLHRPRPVRVLSSPFVVPGLRGQARYACCAAGLAVVPDAAAPAPGASLTARAQADMERPGTPAATARAAPCCWPCPLLRAPEERAGTS